ncbi:MAG TPA: MFS transporter [Segeticoccus sp.]|nr:MFS transporter [Segeticoccus sp.]
MQPIQIIGYGAGDAANNLAFSITAFFLLFYYTDVAGISVAAAGTMFVLIRLWDACTDILAGRIVDKTRTRWGKFRPFLLFGSLPLMVLTFLTFHVLALAISPQIGKGHPEALQHTFTVITGIFVVFGLGLYLFAFFTSRENVERDVVQVSSKETIESLRHNALLAGLIMFTYPLTEAKFASIVEDVRARRAAKAAAVSSDPRPTTGPTGSAGGPNPTEA